MIRFRRMPIWPLLCAALAPWAPVAVSAQEVPPSGSDGGGALPAGDLGALGELMDRKWTIKPRIGVDESYTDNVRLTSRDREGDLITTFGPGILIEGESRRLKTSFDAQVDFDRYLNTTSLNGKTYTVTSLVNAELLEDYGFLDMRTAVNTQRLSRTGVVSAEERTLPSNQTQVFNNTISPYLRHDFGTAAAGELRYRLSTTNFKSVSSESSAASTQPNDTIANTYSFNVHSGPDFARLRWSADGSASNTSYSASDRTIEQDTATLGAEYSITRQIALLAKLGYDTYDDSTSRAPASRDPSWRIGTRLTPSPRTDLSVEGGERFGGEYYSGSLTYRVSEGLTLKASHDTSVTTQQQAIGSALANAVWSATDTTAGSASTANNTDLGFDQQSYTAKTTSLTLSGQRGRTAVDVSAEHQDREVGATSLAKTAGTQNRTVDSLRVNLRRELTPMSEFAIRLGLSMSDDGADSSETTATAGATYSYRLSESLTGTLAYTHLNRTNDEGTGYHENLFAVGLRKTF